MIPDNARILEATPGEQVRQEVKQTDIAQNAAKQSDTPPEISLPEMAIVWMVKEGRKNLCLNRDRDFILRLAQRMGYEGKPSDITQHVWSLLKHSAKFNRWNEGIDPNTNKPAIIIAPVVFSNRVMFVEQF